MDTSCYLSGFNAAILEKLRCASIVANFSTVPQRLAVQQWETAVIQERFTSLSKLAAILGRDNFMESFTKWRNSDGQVYSLQDAYMICWRRLMRDDLLPWEVEYSMAAE